MEDQQWQYQGQDYPQYQQQIQEQGNNHQKIEDSDNYNHYNLENYSNKNYQVLPQSALLIKLMQSVQRTKQLTSLSQGWCLILLSQFKWNIDFINEKYFDNSHFYKQKIGWQPNLTKSLAMEQIQQSLCNVCCSHLSLYKYICGHQFCIECWIQHIDSNINSGNLFMKCMECQIPILYESIKSINNQKYKKVIDKYQKKLCQMFTTINHSYQCCLGVDCTNCIKSNNLTVTNVRCACGKVFCFKCKGNDHSPCSCEQKSIWIDLVMKEQADAKWISVNAKLCPSCKKAVERSAGCNYMACTCGKSFCYMCSKPWQPDHKDHFKCHIYKQKSDQNLSKQKQVLAKMNFFADKYLNNNAITNDLKKVDTFQRRKFLFEKLDIELTESQFIDLSYKFAIECCESLKWIYAYSYFLDFKDNLQKKQQFECSQGYFQKYKEQLLKKLSYDLKQFCNNLDKNNQIDKQQQRNKLKALKKSIVNYQISTKSFKNKFIIEIQNMDTKYLASSNKNNENKKQFFEKDEKKKKNKK